jgi:hypothetical protein
VGRNPDEEDGRDTDDLADRLIDKREKLQYFVVTGSTAILAFTIATLRDAVDSIGACTRVALVTGGMLLLAAAGIALYAIFKRHRVYAEYLDERLGRAPKTPEHHQAVRRQFELLEAWMMGLFYLGVVVLVGVNAVELFH